MAYRPIYQIYVELIGYEPKIWRRIQVVNEIQISKLAYTLMIAFEMKGNHLYRFELDELKRIKNYLSTLRRKYFIKSGMEENFKIADFGDVYQNESMVQTTINGHRPMQHATDIDLRHLLYHKNDEMIFIYDFGDEWKVKIIFEGIIEDKKVSGKELPRISEGQGFGIIEDCGGVKELKKIREELKQNRQEKFDKYDNWIGKKNFDLDNVDIDDLNFRLNTLLVAYKNKYEEKQEFDERTIKILERRYIF